MSVVPHAYTIQQGLLGAVRGKLLAFVRRETPVAGSALDVNALLAATEHTALRAERALLFRPVLYLFFEILFASRTLPSHPHPDKQHS